MSQEYQRREAQENEPQDWRVVATRTIWAMATGMLTLSFALMLLARMPLSPAVVVVLAGSILGTVAVWGLGRRARDDTSAELAAAQQRLRELEERLANLETINAFEQRLAVETAARQAPQQQPVKEPERVVAEREAAGV